MSSQQRPLSSAPPSTPPPEPPVAQCIIAGIGLRPRCNQPMRDMLTALGHGCSPQQKRTLQRKFWRRLLPLARACEGTGLPLQSHFRLHLAQGPVQIHVECRPRRATAHSIMAGSRCFVRALGLEAEAVAPEAPPLPFDLAEEFRAMEHHPWPMYLLTATGEPLLINGAAETLLGGPLPRAAVGIDALVHPDEALMVKGLWHEALACHRPLQLFARLKKAGAFVTCLLRADPRTDHRGRVTHWVCATLETHSNQWLRAAPHLGEPEGVSNSFLTVASHELRTPLTSLQLNLQLALQRLQRQHGGTAPGSQGIESMVSRSLKQTHRLIEVVSDILDASRIHVDKLQLRQTWVDLRQALLDTLALFDRPFADVGCRITVQLQEDIFGFWDRGRVEQVFFDLLANVLKHAPGSHVLLTACVENEVATVTVTDDGPGIAAQQHEQIFGRFGRAAECRGISGLGLGLYLCRRIVEDHGGTLQVRSNPGEGSTFVARLPLHGVHGSAPVFHEATRDDVPLARS